MATFVAGDVVMAEFPFSDLSGSKLRPALVVCRINHNDFLLCAITSKAYGDTMVLDVPDKDAHSAGLRPGSYLRYSRLFASSAGIIRRKTGRVSSEFLAHIKQTISQWIVE